MDIEVHNEFASLVIIDDLELVDVAVFLLDLYCASLLDVADALESIVLVSLVGLAIVWSFNQGKCRILWA